MNLTTSHAVLEKLDDLRLELVDLAFALDRQGSPEAADVAMTTSARVGELYAELTSADVCPNAVRNARACSLNQ